MAPSLWLACLLLLWCFLIFDAEAIEDSTRNSSLQVIEVDDGKYNDKYLNLTHVRMLRDKARNTTRDALVLKTLQSASGVYNDKEKGKKLGLEKTVFISVIAYNSKENIQHYKVYFRNFLCFTKHYDIDLIVYILHHHLPDVEEEVRSLQQLGVKVLTYPDEKFWSLVAEKRSKIIQGSRFAEYDSDIPCFHSFGALVMLVPQLEVAELGFNVIYFDVDIGLVQDPVPYITRGDADFTVSIEQKGCPEVYPTSRKMEESWENLEPNTGVMHLRASPQGVVLYQKWLRRIVKTNVRNDQTVFYRDSRPVQIDLVDGHMVYSELNFTSSFTPKCNWDYRNTTPTPRVTPSAGTYCFLSEMMFQNGMNSFLCSRKPAFKDDWHVEMLNQLEETQINGTGPKLRLPVIVHANYCNGKTHELEVRGLWLLHEDHAGSNPSPSCKAYNVSDVYFAKKNFTKEVEIIDSDRLALLKTVLVSGLLLKRTGSEEVYQISTELVRRLIPDGDTFLNLGYDWDNVRTIPGAVLNMIPIGAPFKSTSKTPLKAKNTKKKYPD